MNTHREYGHEFQMIRSNVEGACIHCGVRIAMYSDVNGWPGDDQFRIWLHPDGTWSRFGAKMRAGGKTGLGSQLRSLERAQIGIPACTARLRPKRENAVSGLAAWRAAKRLAQELKEAVL